MLEQSDGDRQPSDDSDWAPVKSLCFLLCIQQFAEILHGASEPNMRRVRVDSRVPNHHIFERLEYVRRYQTFYTLILRIKQS